MVNDNILSLLLWGYFFIFILLSAIWVRMAVFTNWRNRANSYVQKMKKQVSWGELIGALVVVFGSLIASYVNIHTTLATQEVRITQLEQNYHDIQNDLKSIKDQNTTILVKLEDKQNRGK